ncbi:unnamed protein product, partial [Mesorhabditis spiculigera]
MAVSYADSMGRYNLILVERQKAATRNEGSFVAHLLQSLDRNEADQACQLIDNVFKTALQNHSNQIADSPR